MSRMLRTLAIVALAAPALAEDSRDWYDFAGDAVIRRTDSTGAGALNPASTLPDLLTMVLSGWTSPTASTNPYNGSIYDPEEAHLFRFDLTFAGLVNPPGPVGPGNFDPFRFGNSPLYGFVDLDIDRYRETGGELGPGASQRFLANIGRFGWLPYENSIGERAALRGGEVDNNYATLPQYERSGADYALVFCGCFDPALVSGDANANGTFDAGETWIVSGRFFQRAGGYKLASFAFGGTQPGLYDPIVKLRFSHSTSTNRTTVSLVYAIDQTGAGQLAGQAAQPINSNVGDHTSIREALQDLIDGATALPLSGPTADLALPWRNRYMDPDFLDPTRWRPTAIFGTSYATPQDSPYVWTDVGFDEVPADVNYDEFANAADRTLVRAVRSAEDGGPGDADGQVNGVVTIPSFGGNWMLHDVTGDGLIDWRDSLRYCRADVNDDMALNILDFNAFINDFNLGHMRADADGSGTLNILDFNAFLNAFNAGCP